MTKDELKQRWCQILGRSTDHHHIFDSEYAVERYGSQTLLQCKCGVGKLYGRAK
jgi:hypothetical protein